MPTDRVLYVTDPAYKLGLRGDAIELRTDAAPPTAIPRHLLGSIVCFGHVGLSAPLMHAAAAEGIAIAWMSHGGRFLARVEGPQSGNILLRRAQHRAADGPIGLGIARQMVLGKLANSRALLRRSAREAQAPSLHEAADAVHAALDPARAAPDLDTLRGVEGAAAAQYFGAFDQTLRGDPALRFTTRNRRPPRDPVNAGLGFVYALLLADVLAAIEATGMDPQLGFLHGDRPGRPSLALDLMEELRPTVADRALLSLINNRQLRSSHFAADELGAVLLTAEGRKVVLSAWSQRRERTVHHPLLNQETTWGLLPHLQARILARHLRGEIDRYVPFVLPG